ncbi:MAG: MTAP family purine nucleoside phosphorylase [Candidatus Thermoplasmatota archaeon]|nr:MTAP family purine nucleoside phosphorylase [Candidatus Thermoplasmatota archaeon]
MNRIGVIGGTGLVTIDIGAKHQDYLEQHNIIISRTDSINAETEFGDVPLKCITLSCNNLTKELIFLQRHHNSGEANKPPHMINHKANLKALEQSGCEVIVSVCSTGTMVADFPPGKVALAGQYIDFTGISTTFNDTFAEFTSVTEPFSNELNAMLEKGLRKSQNFSESEKMYYTYWLAQGPHFETRAEVNAIDKLGGEMVGMTMAREVKLANELGIPYSAICISSNWAAGREPGNPSAELSHSLVSSTANERLDPVMHSIFSLLID